jgi:hypothetical protein
LASISDSILQSLGLYGSTRKRSILNSTRHSASPISPLHQNQIRNFSILLPLNFFVTSLHNLTVLSSRLSRPFSGTFKDFSDPLIMKLTLVLGLAVCGSTTAQDSLGGFADSCVDIFVQPALPGVPRSESHYGRLTASCGQGRHETSLDLNKCLGNDNGRLVWRVK